MNNLKERKLNHQQKQLIIWIAALFVGVAIGLLQIEQVNRLMDFIATIYIRLFQLLAVPTIALAIITTLAYFGNQKDSGLIFRRTIRYTLLTTFSASLVALVLYWVIAPENLPKEMIKTAEGAIPADIGTLTYYDHIISVIPNNIVKPFSEGNVLAVLLLAFAIGYALIKIPDSESKATVVRLFSGFQDILFYLIKLVIWALPLGIVAFSAQLASQLGSGIAIDSIGRYVAVIISGNMIQFFVILPLFLLARGLNPIKVLKGMMPAIVMALFTKSSVATLPLTMTTAEKQLGVAPKVARFVLPVCTTINMNGCAAFILVTSLFVMQNGGTPLTLLTMLFWVVISVVLAIGNAGVPMGCFFLTLSLMSGIGAPVGIMGLILPIYTIIDMIETAENVWSDACVSVMTNEDLKAKNVS